MYYSRAIDKHLEAWASSSDHKPLLLRGARQVGKSTAVRHLGESFESFIELNFEKQPHLKTFFLSDLDVVRILPQLSAICGQEIIAGKSLLFFDEIQECPEAIMSLRYFREDIPALHVVAAGSLLEFALDELPTYGVGRIRSMFMYPMSFDEFLEANGEALLLEARNNATADNPLAEPLHVRLIELIRTYMLVGGMPESVKTWVESHDYLRCRAVLDDLVVSYEADFAKYRRKISPALLRATLRSAAVQASQKFVYSKVGMDYKANDVKKAVEMLVLAGLLVPVVMTSASGLPLGSGADLSYRKMLVFDTGLLLRLLSLSLGEDDEITRQILTAGVADLVNKGSMAEEIAGLELLKYRNSEVRSELYYWSRDARNSLAEVDYLTTWKLSVLPIEVKASVRGGMKSLWIFMREKKLTRGVRSSLENFSKFDYTDSETGDRRRITVCPLYALSQMWRVLGD